MVRFDYAQRTIFDYAKRTTRVRFDFAQRTLVVRFACMCMRTRHAKRALCVEWRRAR